ncbi:DUF4145 domain-containing protein [Pseudomonas tolaasii]|uniref:DUF4145 domain-containing protein n=1 Tax=Pseudomonas tolaasii TaxID=29442 RepID=UPI0027363C15|nr:DUF4145 domain-containing protein [Pseudomonas tolaasii]WLH52297.1 DUF4145 domain-containing protein [Pseudomonas tolaasii]
MKQESTISLERCPHCSTAKPNLTRTNGFETSNSSGNFRRLWVCYACRTCGGVVLTTAVINERNQPQAIHDMWPTPTSVDANVPQRAKQYLEQAIASIHAPSGAVMLAASAVDAMLKEKGLKDGNLYGRIKTAATQHLITEEMAAWAHEVRLDANDERHVDEEAELPTTEDAKRATDFALALAQFLFVLPSRVARGRGK